MERGILKDFFPKEVTFGKEHVADCQCQSCLEADAMYDELMSIWSEASPHQIKFWDCKQICSDLDADMLDALACCADSESLQLLNSHLEQLSNATTQDDGGRERCECVVCSVRRDAESTLEHLCSNKPLDDSDLLDIPQEEHHLNFHLKTEREKDDRTGTDRSVCVSETEEEAKSYLVCEVGNPIIISTKDGSVEFVMNANMTSNGVGAGGGAGGEGNLQVARSEAVSRQLPLDQISTDVHYLNIDEEARNAEERPQTIKLKPLDLNEVVDICLCEGGTLSPYCLKHCVAYCQHMQTKLNAEGCTCTKEEECLFCQRLACRYCSHERQPQTICRTMSDKQTDEVEVTVSRWMDSKLSEGGVSSELIEKCCPLTCHEKGLSSGDSRVDQDHVYQQIHHHLDRLVMQSGLNESQAVSPPHSNFTLTEHMRQRMLDMNQLFDIRSFPRCYRLKGVKNEQGVYSDIREDFMELGFEGWKVPTQFVEQTFPLASPSPDLLTRLEKEEDIRKRTRNQGNSFGQNKVKIVGLTDDWRLVVENQSKDSDYSQTHTLDQKQAWAHKIYEEIMNKCEGSWQREKESTRWATVQHILDKYCEETLPSNAIESPPTVDLDRLLQEGARFADVTLKRFPNSPSIGYRAEFWKGLEDWKPDESENEVRKQLDDEVKKFVKELDSFKNDFERALGDRPEVEVDVQRLLNEVILSLPEGCSERVLALVSELPSDWTDNPKKHLQNLDSLVRNFERTTSENEASTPRIDRNSESICDPEPVQDWDDESFDYDSDKKFFYDDEEADDAMVKDSGDSSHRDERLRKDSETADASSSSILKDNVASDILTSCKQKLTHRPAPYVVKMKEDMVKNCGQCLDGVQKLWYDKPMFPFWTPNAIYDLSEIDRLFFEGVADFNPDISDDRLREIEKRLLHDVTVVQRSPEAPEPVDTRIPTPQDEPDRPSNEPRSETAILSKTVEVGASETTNTKRKTGKKVASDEDCLIKEDDFKAAIEQLLQSQTAAKLTEKESGESEAGGGLSLEQMKKGVAGRVKSICEGAIELDSDKDINLDAVVPCPALVYPFKLDIFQKQAIIALEAGLSVFVAAHTSAGKTVAAEYAIAMALRNGCRVVYTSPIKALSNQKYNDFSKKFKGQMKVGIITGDVQLNKEAECLIMTTEILRSMLYNQNSILSDLEFVIFDEVHYFNDPERGNVWEEVLILLPQQCQLVMLSATVPNVMNFASWVGTLRKREVIVTTTYRRPVPLNHYIHYSNHPKHVQRCVIVMEPEGKFLHHNFMKAMDLKNKVDGSSVFKGMDKRVESKNWIRFIRGHLEGHQRLPAVIFCFSRKRCDELAYGVQAGVDLVQDSKKKRHIENFFNRQINMLEPQDREIHQIVTMKALLQRGIGVHHSGILPILKEIVEVLFSESQIKLLFATETFAMGVNMPAKTVVFQQVWKFDGVEPRPLKPGEYTQMAGRAGRRGTDKSGTVIITEWNSKNKCVKEDDLNNMLTGCVESLKSQFRLRYSMILSALKPEGENSIHSIIQKSFFDFSLQAQRTKTNELGVKEKKELMKVAEVMYNIPQGLRDVLCQYCSIASQFFLHHDSIREKMFEHKHYKQYLTVGRLVTVSYQCYANVYGIIVGVDPVSASPYHIAVMSSSQCHIPSIKERYEEACQETVELWNRLVGLRKLQLLPLSHVGMIQPSESFQLIHCKPLHIIKIFKNCQYKINRGLASAILDTLNTSKSGGMCRQNPDIDAMMQFMMNVLYNAPTLEFLRDDAVFHNVVMRTEVSKYLKLAQALDEHINNVRLPSVLECPLLDYTGVCFWFHEKKRAVDKHKVEAQKEKLKSLFDDFDSKLIFLKQNKYIKEDEFVVDTKGRIASRMNNFEVFVTEILLKNVLKDLDGPETAALLSCLVIPGVNTEVTDSSNQLNPLFQNIELEDPNQPSVGSGPRAKLNMKKVGDKIRKTEKDAQVNTEDLREKKNLISNLLTLTPRLQQAKEVVDEIRLTLIQQEAKLNIEPMEGVDLNKVTFYLMPIVYAWAKGMAIRDIMKVLVPTIQEGILVKWIMNLNETLRDIDSATHHFLNDSSIKEKFESASNSIKRGIIDTPSLYLNQRTHTI